MTTTKPLNGRYGQLLREASEFYMRRGSVFETMRELASRLDREGIEYAIVGGMALAHHGLMRVTQDVDVLMTESGLDVFRRSCVGRGYTPAFAGARKTFRDTRTNVLVEIIVAGEYPGDGEPKAVAFPPPGAASVRSEGVSVISLPKLIELKLASGMSAQDRLRDLADVQDMIRTLNLSAEFADALDPSVRPEFIRLWRAVGSGESGPGEG